MKELELYRPVMRFLAENLDCFFVANEAGKQGVGSVDVFGVRYISSSKSEIETIGVEVKTSHHKRLSTNFGQAKGYSVFCERPYFASVDALSGKNELEIANFLGIGLIKIEGENPNYVCSEVLEAPKNTPIPELRNYVLRYKGIFQCESCMVFQKSDVTEVTTEPTEWTRNEIRNHNKGLLIKHKLDEKFYCNACAKKMTRTTEKKTHT
jgi:hypothetical protein